MKADPLYLGIFASREENNEQCRAATLFTTLWLVVIRPSERSISTIMVVVDLEEVRQMQSARRHSSESDYREKAPMNGRPRDIVR